MSPTIASSGTAEGRETADACFFCFRAIAMALTLTVAGSFLCARHLLFQPADALDESV